MTDRPSPRQATGNRKPVPLRCLRTTALCALIFASVFLFHHNFFYRHGGYLLDSGYYAFLFYRSGIVPHGHPLLVSEHFGTVFFKYHLSPLLSLISLASYLAPLGRIDWFSCCQAAFYALIACGMCSLADRFFGDRKSAAWVAVGGALGLIYALNGFVISCLGYPHIEIALPAFGLCFLAALLRQRKALTWLFFALACCMREDAGFHLSLVLGALWIAGFIEKHLSPMRRRFLLFACLAFAASVMMLVAQRIFFPHPAGGPSPFQYGFFDGRPASITWEIIGQRLLALPHTALSLILAVAASAVCAVVTRRYVLLLCWVVNIPWFAVNLIAVDPSRHALGIYHVFPFILAVAWPFMALPPLEAGMPRARLAGWLAVVFLLGIASTAGQRIAMPGMFNEVVADLVHFRFQKEKPFDALVRSLQNEPQLYGRLGLDDGMGCLFLDDLQKNQIDHDKQHYDTVIFFKETMFSAQMLQLVMRDHLDHCAPLAGTNVLVVSNREIPAGIGAQPLLKPASLWLELARFMPANAFRVPDGSIVQSSPGVCILAYGPYVSLPAGKYKVTFQIDGATPADTQSGAAKLTKEPVAKLGVSHAGGTIIDVTADVYGAELPATKTLEFEVAPGEEKEQFEFCVVSLGRERLRVNAISLQAE